MPPRTDLKRRGEVVELLFQYRAAALGLTVCKPYGDSAKYDFLIDASGHFTRVQVRSVSILQHSAYRISCGSGADKKPYTRAEIDLLAAYIVPEDAWYIIPVSAFAPAIGIRLHPGSCRRFERFRDAWHLLWTAAPKRRTASPNPLTALCSSASPCPVRLLDA